MEFWGLGVFCCYRSLHSLIRIVEFFFGSSMVSRGVYEV